VFFFLFFSFYLSFALLLPTLSQDRVIGTSIHPSSRSLQLSNSRGDDDVHMADQDVGDWMDAVLSLVVSISPHRMKIRKSKASKSSLGSYLLDLSRKVHEGGSLREVIELRDATKTSLLTQCTTTGGDWEKVHIYCRESFSQINSVVSDKTFISTGTTQKLPDTAQYIIYYNSNHGAMHPFPRLYRVHSFISFDPLRNYSDRFLCVHSAEDHYKIYFNVTCAMQVRCKNTVPYNVPPAECHLFDQVPVIILEYIGK